MVDDALTREVTDYLLGLGVSEAEIAHARNQGLLSVLAVSRIAVPGQAHYTQAEVAARASIDPELSKRFWRALGFPDVEEDASVFTDADVEALLTMSAFMQVGRMEPEVAVQMTRVVGSSMARIAEAQIGLSGEHVRPAETHELLTLTMAAALDSQARLLEYVWRRHLQAASLRAVMAAGGTGDRMLTVGFADLVGFTALSQQLEQRG
jgi:adenylate cyclase